MKPIQPDPSFAENTYVLMLQRNCRELYNQLSSLKSMLALKETTLACTESELKKMKKGGKAVSNHQPKTMACKPIVEE